MSHLDMCAKKHQYVFTPTFTDIGSIELSDSDVTRLYLNNLIAVTPSLAESDITARFERLLLNYGHTFYERDYLDLLEIQKEPGIHFNNHAPINYRMI